MKLRITVLGFMLASFAVAQDLEKETADLDKRLDSIIFATMKSEHILGVSYIVVKDGKTLLKKGYGFTTLGGNATYVHPDSTIFRIGSITKTFTALALLQQVEKGKIALAEDVNNHLTSIKVPDTYSTPITPHHLLTHSAGFDEVGGRRVFQRDQQIP